MKIAQDLPRRRWCPTCRAKQVFIELTGDTLECPQCHSIFTEDALARATEAETDRLLRIGRNQL
jgi:Zn finger protein HypA/HybF involved in hydrogenase expression